MLVVLFSQVLAGSSVGVNQTALQIRPVLEESPHWKTGEVIAPYEVALVSGELVGRK
jgi:hypothetical protein